MKSTASVATYEKIKIYLNNLYVSINFSISLYTFKLS